MKIEGLKKLHLSKEAEEEFAELVGEMKPALYLTVVRIRLENTLEGLKKIRKDYPPLKKDSLAIAKYVRRAIQSVDDRAKERGLKLYK